MKITSHFDSGNIHVVSADSPDSIQLTINKDNQSDFYQWFHFKLEADPDQTYVLTIQNLAKSAYPTAWKGYHAVASYDRENWFRVPTEFDGDNLIISHAVAYRHTYFAYFAPYSHERHLNLLAQSQMSDLCTLHTLGNTLDGRELSLLKIGQENANKKVVWITARQHPGETMAQWLVEGLLNRLLDEDDGVARSLLQSCVFYVIPNMNPDGSCRGHLRTNAIGVNLNREWAEPSIEKSPEVYLTLAKMRETGVDLFLDVHGDEELPYNFVAGAEGNPGYNGRIAQLESDFKQALMAITPEFQDVYGYPKDAPGEGNMTVATNAVGQEFACLAFTLEMPFKDNNDLPDAVFGWSPRRCQQLGEDVLVAIHQVKNQLR